MVDGNHRLQDHPKPMLVKMNAAVRSRINRRVYSPCTPPASSARWSDVRRTEATSAAARRPHRSSFIGAVQYVVAARTADVTGRAETIVPSARHAAAVERVRLAAILRIALMFGRAAAGGNDQ